MSETSAVGSRRDSGVYQASVVDDSATSQISKAKFGEMAEFLAFTKDLAANSKSMRSELAERTEENARLKGEVASLQKRVSELTQGVIEFQAALQEIKAIDARHAASAGS